MRRLLVAEKQPRVDARAGADAPGALSGLVRVRDGVSGGVLVALLSVKNDDDDGDDDDDIVR